MNSKDHTFVIDANSRKPLNLKEIWEFRELLYFFAWRDIKVKYKQTFLGVTWAFIQPFLMMLVLNIFFGQMLHFPSETLPYSVFAFTGLIIWNIFSSGTINSSNSMLTNAVIIKKNYFPRIILPLAAVIVSLFDFLVSFILFGGLLIWFRVLPDVLRFIAFFPFAVLIALITTVGTGVIIGAMSIRFRDFRIVMPFLIQLLLFITPVIYPISAISNKTLYHVLALNPMAGAISLARAALTHNPVDWIIIGISSGMAVFIFILGMLIFKKNETLISDLA